MTREEHLKYCRNCQNRKLDFQQGLICGLSGERAAFEEECEHFSVDGEAVMANANRAISDAGATQSSAAAQRNMLYGALWFIGGTAVTVLSYQGASHGGRYVIAWGAIVFGLVQFIRGLVQHSNQE